jgi:two-component system, response regulator, stage 0 sporulation protein F
MPNRNPIILVVEEEEGIRNLLNLILSENGFQVLLASRGVKGVELFQKWIYDVDLVLMDVRMRGMDGPQTLTQLRKLRRDIRCCFMTGDPSRTDELLAQGALRVFPKPFSSLDDIVQGLRKIVES